MSENLHDIDKIFHDALDGNEELPPPGLWDAIDHQLDKQSVVNINRKYKSLKRFAALLAVLLTGAIAWGIYSNGRTNAAADEASKPYNPVLSATKPLQPTLKPTIDSNLQAGADASKAKNKEDAMPAESLHPDTALASDQRAIGISKANNNSIAGAKTNSGRSTNVTHKQSRLGQPNSRNFVSGNESIAAKNSNADALSDYNTGAAAVAININGSNSAAPLNQTVAVYHTARRFEPLVTAFSAALPGAAGSATPKKQLREISVVNSSVLPVNKLFKKPAFSIMPFYAANISFNRIQANHRDGAGMPPRDHERERNEIKNGERHHNNYVAGVQLSMPLSGRWLVQTGIGYAVQNIASSPKNAAAISDSSGNVKYRFDCSAGYVYLMPKGGLRPSAGDTARFGNATTNLQYITVPLGVAYRLSYAKFAVLPSASANANFLINQSIETSVSSGAAKELYTVTNINGLKKVYFNAQAGIAFEYRLSRSVAVNMMPAVNFSLEPINRNAAVKSYPNSFSVSGGIKLNF